MRLTVLLLALVLLLPGCSDDIGKKAPGVWSNGALGKILDISPNGFYADVYVESQVQVSTWEIPDETELHLRPMCSSLPENGQILNFRYDDGGLEFPRDGARFVRFVKERPTEPIDKDAVGLWYGESKTRRKEFLEFTPWGTLMWNRWAGEVGEEKLIAGWGTPFEGERSDEFLLTGVEDGELLTWSKPVTFKVEANRMTIFFPKPIGKKEYTRTTRSELMQASRGMMTR